MALIPCDEAEAQEQVEPTSTEERPECGEGLDDLLRVAGRGRSGSSKIWEVGDADPTRAALEWFNRLVDPRTIRAHRNPDMATLGGLEGTLKSGDGTVLYRPRSGSGGPAVDVGDHKLPECSDLKFHFEPRDE